MNTTLHGLHGHRPSEQRAEWAIELRCRKTTIRLDTTHWGFCSILFDLLAARHCNAGLCHDCRGRMAHTGLGCDISMHTRGSSQTPRLTVCDYVMKYCFFLLTGGRCCKKMTQLEKMHIPTYGHRQTAPFKQNWHHFAPYSDVQGLHGGTSVQSSLIILNR